MSTPPGQRFTLLEGSWAVIRLDPGAPVPEWAWTGPFCSVSRTPEELSVVCLESAVPAGAGRIEGGWALLRLHGPFPFQAVGILASVAQPLALAGVSLFAVSTFDTDYFLIKRDQLPAALDALAAAGHMGENLPRAAGET